MFESTTIPTSRPPWTSRRSSGGSSSIVSRSFSSAGLPASSPITWPSPAVIVSSGPIGAAPCETIGSTSTPSSRTPTAPSLTTSSPMNRIGSSSIVRPEARPPSSGSIGVDSLRNRRTASVGKETGSASRIAPPAPFRSGIPVSAPVPASSSSTAAWNAAAVPSPRLAAHTDTADPASISRPCPITPPAPHPISSSGASTSWTASSAASGAARNSPHTNSTTRSQAAPSSSAAANDAASSAATRESSAVDRPVPMRTDMARHDTPRSAPPSRVRRGHTGPPMQVIAVFGPTGVGKTAVAIALAKRLRERGEDPVAVSADAMQVYEGLPILTGAATPTEQAELEHRLLGFVPITETFSAGAYAERAHREIDALLAHGRRPIVVGGTGLYLRAALAELDLRPPVDPDIRRRLAERPIEQLHAELPEAVAAGIAPTDRQRIIRAHELLAAGHEPPPPANAPSQLWTTHTRHPTLLAALVMDRDELADRIDERVDADDRRRSGAGGRASARGGRIRHRPPRARLRRAPRPATSRP